MLLTGSGAVVAQVRAEDSASQRILPLPDGGLSNADTQMQLLRRLRSLVNAANDSGKPEATPRETPDIDDRQFQQLQQALKKLQDQLLPGMKSPDLGSTPEEQLDDAISNPAVQQQLKKMLEQFSRDSLSQIAQGENHKSFDDVESQRRSLQAFQDLLERYKDSGERIPEQDSSNRVLRRPDRIKPMEPQVSPGPRVSERGEVFPPAEMPSRSSSRVGREPANPRSENRAEIGRKSAPSGDSLPSVSEFLKDQLLQRFRVPNADDAGKSEQGSTPPIANGRERSESRDRIGHSGSTPDNSNRAAAEGGQPDMDIRRELDRSGIRGTVEKLVEKAMAESNAQQRAQQQQQQQSIGDSARGMIDAGSESPQSGAAVPSNEPPTASSHAGVPESLRDLLSGLGQKMPEILDDATFEDRTAESPRAPESAGQSSSGDSESRLKKWNDAASEFLSDLSQAPVSPDSVLKGEASPGADSPLPIGSFFLTGLALFGLLAVMAFCLRRPLLQLVLEATGTSVPTRIRQPGEIHSRDDVISAFHALALNSRQRVESWWTHRAVATKLAAASPLKKDAVQTLAEIYEQARYLPDDVELPADTIQSARTALIECQ